MVQVKRGRGMMVSDAMAKNSRQLLNAHIYNYLIENKRYETARQFLVEADVPLSEERSDDEGSRYTQVRHNVKAEGYADLLPASMMMDCAETFLHEWWECFNCLQRFVDNTALEDLKENDSHDPIVPLVPANNDAFGGIPSGSPNVSRVPPNINTSAFPQPARMGRTTNVSPNVSFNGQYSNYEPNQNGSANAYAQENVMFPMQQQPPQTQQYPRQFPQPPQR